MYKVRIHRSFYLIYKYMSLQKFIHFWGEGGRIIFLISANKITHQIDVCSYDSACAATECRSPLKTICCAQNQQDTECWRNAVVRCIHHSDLSYRGSLFLGFFFPQQKRRSFLSWADCVFVAQAVDELSVLLLLCCRRLGATNVFLSVFRHPNANSYKQKMRGTVRGLCWSCECLEGRASWRRRKPQYSPLFCCKLGPKTPTFQPCQHHRYCQILQDTP